MDRLRTPKRVFAYPDLNVELTITQGWDESGAGTGAAVWDSAERLARCVAETGALSALRQHPTAALRVRDVDDARAWWRGKTVVELGAGLGLTSLVAASAGALALCTDGDDRVVRMCAENARANASNARARAEDERETARDSRVPPHAARLLWGDEDDARTAEDWIRTANEKSEVEKVEGEIEKVEGCSRSRSSSSAAHPAVILLADVVYGERSESWRALVGTLRRLAGVGDARGDVAHEKRKRSVRRVFRHGERRGVPGATRGTVGGEQRRRDERHVAVCHVSRGGMRHAG